MVCGLGSKIRSSDDSLDAIFDKRYVKVDEIAEVFGGEL
jgi:hypothetical protein